MVAWCWIDPDRPTVALTTSFTTEGSRLIQGPMPHLGEVFDAFA
jgi:hypothetical protein